MTRRTRRTTALGIAATMFFIAAHASTAHAQTNVRLPGWTVDRFEPSPAGDVFFVADHPWYNSTRLLALSVVGDYAHNPLVVCGGDCSTPGTIQRVIIRDMFVLHAQGEISLFDRIGLGFSVPISLWQTGDPGTAATLPALNAYSSPVTGDPRLSVRVRVAGQADRDPISLHFGAHVILGGLLDFDHEYNDPSYNVTDDAVQARVYMSLAGRIGPMRWSLTGGYHYRPDISNAGAITVSPAVFLNAGIGFVSPDGRLTVGPEAWIAYQLDAAPNASFVDHLAGDAILGVHYFIADTILVGVGAGHGLGAAAGTPDERILARIAYAPIPTAPTAPPPPRDSDFDGVPDDLDLCPHEPAGAHPDPDHRGCPVHDVDNDGVPDATDLCPTVAAGEHPDPERAGCPENDTDQDGVFDHEDRCVTTPAGEHPDPDRPGCPDGDDDNDGVLNHQDACPTTHAGIHPDPSRPGCPLPDRDNDGVPDATDHCPDQPGAPSPDPNRNGCPGLVRIEGGQVRILQQVFFATNSDRILPRSNRVLQAVADALTASPHIRRVAIEGHTDNQGRAERNLTLSQRRAESVMRWLVQHGIDPARLEAHGYGQTRPLAPNDTSAGRAQNRRVEFHIVDPPQSTGSEAPSGAPVSSASSTPATSSAPANSGAPSSAPASAAPASSAPPPIIE